MRLFTNLRFIACLSLAFLLLHVPKSSSQVQIEFDRPLFDKPGAMPFRISEILTKLFPEYRNPRLMTLKDISDADDQNEFFESGYSFVLRGDFDKDNKADIAFVGRHEVTSGESVFFAIISITRNIVARRFVIDQACNNTAFLMFDPNVHPSTGSIAVHCTLSSDYCFYVYWNGRNFVSEKCKQGP